MLRAIGRQRGALDVAAEGDGDDHVLADDQVFVFHVGVAIDDHAAARNGELVAHLDQFLANHGHDVGAVRQQVEEALDGFGQRGGLVADLVTAQAGQARQGQGQDGAGLLVAEADQAALFLHGARVGDQVDQRQHVAGRPGLGHQALAGLGRILGRADDVDEFVDIGDGDGQADQDVAAIARLAQFELGPPDHDLFAELNEDLDQLLEAHLLGAAPVQGQHVDAERALQRREAVELVEDDLARSVALQLDHDAHAVAVGFVADVRHALDALIADHLGDVLDQIGLVHLIGDGRDDDGFATGADLFHGGQTAHDHRAAAGQQRLARSGPADDLAAGREVGTGH